MHFLICSGCRIETPVQIVDQCLQLPHDLTPFAESTRRQEPTLEFLIVLAVAFFGSTRSLSPIPELDIRKEIRAFVSQFFMCFIGGLLLLGWAFARILHRQPRSDNQEFAQCTAASPFKEHSAELGINRQPGETAADFRQFIVFTDGSQFLQNCKTIGKGLRRRRLHKREFTHVTQAQRLGAQDNSSEIRAHDLWIGECRPTSEILFTVKPNTDAFRYAAAAARALVGRSLTNGLNEQLLDLGAIRIAFDTRVTGIHHIADAGNGNGCFSNVCGEHNASHIPRRLEDFVLIGRRKTSVERQNFCLANARAPQLFGRSINFAFARQKYQNIPSAAHFTLAYCIVYRSKHRAVIVFITVFNRAPPDFHRISAPGNGEHRRGFAVDRKVIGKTLGINRG